MAIEWAKLDKGRASKSMDDADKPKTGVWNKEPKTATSNVMARQDFSNDKIGPNMGRDAKPVEKKSKAKPKASAKKLKDTSDRYWSADGLSGDMGSASGESGPDMGQVNKGGYDPEVGMKKGGFVHAKDAIAKHSGGFKHHMDGMKQHAAGFKSHIDHVKLMCGGGMTKGKR